MSFATSSSAFGIKSNAPASATAFGTKPAGTAFGSQPQGGLFGNSQQQQQQPQSNQPAGSSLFGGGQNQQQQPQQGSSLFGNPQTQPPQPSLFGNPQTQPQQSTSLFGGPSQPQQNQQSSSLFGNPSNQPPQTSLFGTAPAQQNQQGGSGSLFGSTQQPAQPSSSLFGSTPAQPQQQQSSLFGNQSSTWGARSNPLMPPATQPAANFGTGSSTLFNQSQQQQQQQQPQSQQMNVAPLPQQATGPLFFTKSTKFNDLPDNIKKTFEDIDGHIQGRIHIGKELKQRKLADQATKGQELIRDVHKELGIAVTTLRSDLHVTKDLKAKVDQSVQDTIVATRIVDGFRNPQQSGAYLKNHATFPLEFFERITIQMRDRLQWYKSTIEQIERKLASASSQAQYTPQSISSSLAAQHATFVALANKTAVVDAELQKIKALYTQLWRAKTGSMRDPFNELDRGNGGDFGLEGLTVG